MSAQPRIVCICGTPKINRTDLRRTGAVLTMGGESSLNSSTTMADSTGLAFSSGAWVSLESLQREFLEWSNPGDFCWQNAASGDSNDWYI